jgi:16S rRNA (cytosine967-C5)-methyltransferase
MIDIENFKLISNDLKYTIKIIFKDNIYTTKAIMKTLKSKEEWNDKKKGLFSETIYDIVRYWRYLWFLVGKEPSYDDNDLNNLLKVYLFYREVNDFNNKELLKQASQAKKDRAIRESIPNWLDELCTIELGNKWDDVLRALNQKPDLIIRVNTLKLTVDKLIKVLKDESVQSNEINNVPDALIIKNKINMYRLKSFKEGFFEIQDVASQIVSRFLNPESGILVVDACAGEGSKTLHLSALMKNHGRIIAMDPYEWKLNELKRRARKAGAYNIETRLISSSKSYKRLKGKVDKILIDVPCSGLGTLRRNPDVKWKLSLSDLERLKELQGELLNKYTNLLKKGGQMVYSTCSILPSEGEEQIKTFLKNQKDNYSLIKEKRYWPNLDNTDGFYMALIERTEVI